MIRFVEQLDQRASRGVKATKVHLYAHLHAHEIAQHEAIARYFHFSCGF